MLHIVSLIREVLEKKIKYRTTGENIMHKK